MFSNRAFVLVVLLWCGCRRAPNQHQSKTGSNSESPANTQISPPNPTPIGAVKPSPFAEPRPEDVAGASTARLTPATATSERKTARRPINPFIPPTIQSTAAMRDSPTLPLPPVVPRPRVSAAANLLPGYVSCCMATATYEMAKPGRLQRVIKKIPGLRRIERDNRGGEDFFPPRPLHDITFVLPSGASPAAMEQKGMDVKASIDESGRVTRIELLAPKDLELVKLAAYAASNWRFTPALRNKLTVSSEVILHFRFDGDKATPR
jgi:hypothetical protein